MGLLCYRMQRTNRYVKGQVKGQIGLVGWRTGSYRPTGRYAKNVSGVTSRPALRA
jgi:hypothetical protein